jgi:signal transduction histidine kinase
MDNRKPGVISATLETLMRDSLGRQIFLNFNLMPITGKEGEVTHYFGMCRNETEMTYTEKKLREETEKAQETEQLKNRFLLNMSYELRTPLSAVIGFAELFNGDHSPEDEPVFAEEIRKNTGELLKLINDILFISRLDSRMIEYNYQECDFATMFDGWCYMGWSTLPPDVKVVVENPYTRLMANIDSQNLGMVIQKVCTFSANSIKEGIVRAKYEYRHGELMITIEDTGEGISKNDLPHVFERFVLNEDNEHFGSGLDLPIIQELTEQMGGSFEINSELGRGTTVWISIPCQVLNIERKDRL